MAREIKIFLIVITGLCVLLIGLYMQANDRREARLDKYLDKKLENLPAERVTYVDLDPNAPAVEPKRILTKVVPPPEPPAAPQPATPKIETAPVTPITDRVVRAPAVGFRARPGFKQPLARKRDIAKAKRKRTYIVKKGDTLSEISSRELGSAKLFMKIFKANRNVLKSPNILPIGAKLVLPDVPGQRATAAAPAPQQPHGSVELEDAASSIPRSLSLKSTKGSLESVVDRQKVTYGYAYRVGRGETVYSIARKVYGDERRASDILTANADLIGDPDNIPTGLRIRLPQ